jgi:GNAT superfamily N-acetyltransferase
VSLWADYIKEREDCDTIEREQGFITYRFQPNGDCFIRDFFVQRVQRNQGVGQELFDELGALAVKHEVKRFVAEVDLRAATSTQSLGIILSRGFQAVGAQNHIITLIQEIHYGGSC